MVLWVPKNDTGGVATSPWAGKKWMVIGDSITNYGYSTTASYHKLIATQLGMSSINGGVSGTGYFASNTQYYNFIDAGTTGTAQIDPTADLVTVLLGTNDWAENHIPERIPLSLGSLGDTATTSFYGAVDYTFKQLALKYRGKPIGIMTPLPRSDAWDNVVNTGGVTMTQVADAIIAVAKKYSMPVLDLYRESNFNMWDASFRSVYATDGLHPTDIGHQILARKIIPFINSL